MGIHSLFQAFRLVRSDAKKIAMRANNIGEEKYCGWEKTRKDWGEGREKSRLLSPVFSSTRGSTLSERLEQARDFTQPRALYGRVLGHVYILGLNQPRVFRPQVCGRGSQERMFFLFSDILLYAKKGGSMDKEQR